jgi:uncharacterized coiled-coil DUF342 family protein
MNRSTLVAVLATTVLLAAAPLPALAQGVPKKVTETGEAIRDYTVERKDEAVAHARKLASDLDAKIKELEAQAAKRTGEAKAKLQEQIKDLKAKRDEASRKLNDLTRASRASWDRAKEGFADAYRDLAQAYARAAAEFKK